MSVLRQLRASTIRTTFLRTTAASPLLVRRTPSPTLLPTMPRGSLSPYTISVREFVWTAPIFRSSLKENAAGNKKVAAAWSSLKENAARNKKVAAAWLKELRMVSMKMVTWPFTTQAQGWSTFISLLAFLAQACSLVFVIATGETVIDVITKIKDEKEKAKEDQEKEKVMEEKRPRNNYRVLLITGKMIIIAITNDVE